MMMFWMEWIIPAALIALSLMVGLWLQRFALPRLFRWASHTRWEADDAVLRTIRGPIVLWSLMAGVYLALRFSAIPSEVVDVIGRVLKVLWIFSVTWVSTNVLVQMIAHYASKWQVGLPMTSLTQNLTKVVILALGLLIILDSLGVRIASLLAALGIGSLAVALGLQDTLVNFFAGVYVTLSKNVRVGDYIRLENEEEGYVTDIGWRATKILTLPNNIIIVPNAKISQSIMTNYCLPDPEVVVTVEVSVDYASDLARVEHVTCDVAQEVLKIVPGSMTGFTPVVRFHSFGDAGVNLTVVLRAKQFVDQYLIKHEFIKRLHARYEQEGIAMPFPIRTIQARGVLPVQIVAPVSQESGRRQ